MQELLPKSEQANVGLALSRAYLEHDYDKARRALEHIAEGLENRYPKAAVSLREGLEETLSVHRLKVPGLLRQTLSNTNAMESANSVAASVIKRVSRFSVTPPLASWKRKRASAVSRAIGRFPCCSKRSTVNLKHLSNNIRKSPEPDIRRYPEHFYAFEIPRSLGHPRETGLYYLQSRYYDPNTGRFINADDTDVLNNTDKNLLSVNLFAYCENNPVNKIDDDGHLAWLLAGAAFLILGVGEVLMAVAVVALVVVAAAVVATAINYGVHQYQNQQALNLAEKSAEKKKRVNSPPARRVKNQGSKKKAYEKAKRAGNGREPRHDPNGHPGDPRPHLSPRCS